MKFRRDTDEQTCTKTVWYRGHEAGCFRTAGHPGECEAVAYRAGQLDGVCFACRVPIGQPHDGMCWRKGGDQ